MKSIGNAQSFSGKTPITPSRDFSVETLTGITLLWKTELNRSILSRSSMVDFTLFYFIFIFIFIFSFLFFFYF